MKRLGLTVGSLLGSLAGSVDLIREAEELGYSDVWSEESGGTDGLTPLAAIAATTRSVRLGSAVLPVFTRPPALVAMGAASLQDLSSGRFVLGVGTSSSIIVERWMGTAFESPLKRLEEYVLVLREILSGKKVTYSGETIRVDGFRLQHPVDVPVPIYVAALGPAACRLAGRVADGVAFFMKTADGVRQALGWVAEGAEAVGRDPTDLDCLIRVPVAVDEDPEVLSFMARRMLTGYAMVDVYNRSLVVQGYGAQAAAIAEAWDAGERDRAAEAIDDEMLGQLVVFGDLDRCRDGIEAFREAGVKTPILLPVSVAGDPAERVERVRASVRSFAGT